IYYAPTMNVTISGGGVALIGPTTTIPVTGGMPTVHAKNVWNSYATAKPTGIVYNDNWKKSAPNGRADLRAIPDTSGTPATLIATQAEADFFLSHDKTKVVYAWLSSLGMEGVYVATLP